MKKRFKRITSMVLATVMVVTSFTFNPTSMKVNAQQTAGNAPFINSWLVSGPFDSPVVDKIYGNEIPEKINFAPLASEITASSTSFPTNPARFVADGSTSNQWVTENDFEPWVKLKWNEPVTINEVKIAQWGDGRHVNDWYHITFTLEDNTIVESGKVNSTSASSSEPTVYVIQSGLKNVIEMKVEVDKGRTPYPNITGISEIEIYNNPDIAPINRPTDGNWAKVANATASSTWKTNAVNFPDGTDSQSALPKFAIDGNMSTEWISQMHNTGGAPSTWPTWDPAPTLFLAWNHSIKVKTIEVFDRYNSAWGGLNNGVSDVEKVECTLKDKTGKVLGTKTITEIDPNGITPGVAVFDTAIEGVSRVELKIIHDGQKNNKNVGLGFKEVNIFDGDGIIQPPEPEPAGTITPIIGENLIYNEESQTWEYFDDRLWNRNYDDYQDLHGYYTIKQGINTQNKYVNVHTYVYSPVEQNAQFRVGASGSYRLYVNDIPVTSPSIPVEVQKDLTKKDIHLKQGWNKLLIQLKHTFTEDTNANGVPIAKDLNVSYLGFYGRVTDSNGNEIKGLEYSVIGNAAKVDAPLTIETQGLKNIDDDEAKSSLGLPENIMPIGYTEWPYVWNKSTGTAIHGVSASMFRLIASGGTPAYKWSLESGNLPKGLTLNADGTIGGFIECEPGEYRFTVKVTDSVNSTATKELTITVKERPNKWFEEGRVGALSHCIPIYNYFVDENFSADLWAERAKQQGHSLVSIEALQQNYYWPSKFADPLHIRNLYMPKDENGKVVDGLKQFEEAVKRYGIKFGLYYATEGGGLQHYSTDVFVQNVADLIKRYDPAYLYFDGPQAMRSANYDVMYSNVRNYNNDIIINSNAWGEEFGDPDLRTAEASHIYANAGGNHLTKRTTMEPWKSVHTKNNYTPYYAKRDDYRQVTKEMVMNVGRGYVDNNDQMPLMSRGTNWDSPEEVATRYPKSVQEFIDVREGLASWFAPEGKPERHESTTGTNPYFLKGYGFEDDGKGNYEKFAFPNSTTGPQWGYATYRDNNIYLHIMKGPDSKKGFGAITDKSLTISPVKDNVTSVTWLNEDIPVTSFTQNGDSLTINLTNVQEDPLDTIIKIETDNANRKYTLTNIIATGEQLTASSLKINAEGYMTYPALKVKLSGLTYVSENSEIATVNESGTVTPVSNGTTTITIRGTYEGITKEDALKVTSKDGNIYIGEEMIGATLKVEGKESFGEFNILEGLSYKIEGRSLKGGAIGLDTAEIKWHGGIVDLRAGDNYKPVVINEVDTFTFNQDEIITPYQEQRTRGVVWADVTLEGKTFTTNKVYMDLMPYQNLSKTAEITSSHNQDTLHHLFDGKAIDGIHFDNSKWSVPANEKAWIQFKLPNKTDIANININFNSWEQNYTNTPKTIIIQTSDDGVVWTDASTVNGPTGNAYFGFYNQYALNTKASYVKLIFDGGANYSTIDLLEVAVNGFDKSNMFGDFKYKYQSITPNTGSYDIEAFKENGESLDTTNAKITVTSQNPEIISVNSQNILTAVSEGVAKINISVEADGRTINKTTYIGVDKDGNIDMVTYLEQVNLLLNDTLIQQNKPIVATIEGTLNTGEKADLSRATVEYQFSDQRLSVIEGTNTIILKDDVGLGFKATVTAKVTLNGVTILSNPVGIDAVNGDIIPQSQMTATATSQETASENNTASMAIDGNPQSIWHTKWNKSDLLPQSITLNLGGTYNINKITYLPRQSGSNGNITSYNVYVSKDGVTYSKVASGTFENNNAEKYITFTSTDASFVKLEATDGVGGFASAAEINVYKSPEESVKMVVDYKSVAVDTEIGTMPTLPAQVEAVYNDGTTGLVDVIWDDITEDMVAKEGIFSVNGSVDGVALKAKITVIVKAISDTISPVTTDNAPLGWMNQDVTVTLNSIDENSGVADTFYIVNDGEQQRGSSVVFVEEGIHELAYWSVDNAGNAEEAHTVTISIDKTAPEIEVSVPEEGSIIEDSRDLTLHYTLADALSDLDNSKTTVTLDGNPYLNETTSLYSLPLGQHTIVIIAMDLAGNQGSKTVSFQTVSSIDSLKALVTLFTSNQWIDNKGISNSLQSKLNNSNLNSFVNEVQAQRGKHISTEAAGYLLRDAEYVLSQK